MTTKSKKLLKVIIFFIYSVIIFCIGFSYGNIKASYKNIDKELLAIEQLMKAQGSSAIETVASLEMIRIDRLNQLGGAKRQFLSIYLPSILVAINIFLTVYYKKSEE